MIKAGFLFLLLFLFTSSNAWSQLVQFQGTLIYERETNLVGGQSDALGDYEKIMLYGYDSLVCHIYHSNHIEVFNFNNTLGTKMSSIQDANGINIYTDENAKLNLGNLKLSDVDDFSTVIRTNERKDILGIPCTKIYYNSKSGLVNREAWVAEGFPYKQLHKNGPLFNDFFAPEGLIMEIRITTYPPDKNNKMILENFFKIKKMVLEDLSKSS